MLSRAVLLLLSLPTLISANSPEITLSYTPISSSTSNIKETAHKLATLSYHASNNSYTLSSYTAPLPSKSKSNSNAKTRQLARISHSTPANPLASGSTTITHLSLLQDPEHAVLRIVLDAQGQVLSAGVARDLEAEVEVGNVFGRKSAEKGEGRGAGGGLPRLEVVHALPEPRPVLNKPVVLDAEGKVPVTEKAEPSLLQRYWWVAAIVLLLTLGAGGGGGEEDGK